MKETRAVALVDNDRRLLTSLAMTLEAAGFCVRPYSDTASAFEALAAEPADLTILDLSNSPFDGLELFRRLRQLSDMPMIFLSAHAVDLEKLDVGADDYVTKPFSLSFVVERVETILQGRRCGL